MNIKLTTLPMLATFATCILPATSVAERGSDGDLNIIYWQAPTMLNPYLSSGPKDIEPASLVLEPLARYDETGNLVPWLATEIPTQANGGISEDLTTVTWKLSPDLTWSDGSPFTAHDVVFTSKYCMTAEGGCQQATKFNNISTVEALDDLTVKITFDAPKPFPYAPFVGVETPILQKAQFDGCMGDKAPTCTAENFGPIGTGPFRVADFRSGDVAVFKANPNYRDPNKPAFETVTIKGGGDAIGAARAVLGTGEMDYAWNLQVDPAVLNAMAEGGAGQVIRSFSTAVERMMINRSNPSAELGDARSTTAGGAHPFLTDPAVLSAMSLAIDRTTVSDLGYGTAGKPTCDILPAPAIYASSANDACLTQDLEQANKLLTDAGWIDEDGDGVREKDGVRLSILFQTSTNPVRQDTQALLKDWWSQIGIETELRHIDPSVFFGGDQASPDTFQKFYADVQMFTNFFPGTDPEAYLNNWTCAKIPSPDNNWLGFNIPRYCTAEYDALAKTLAQTSALEERAAIARQMNDMLMQAGALIPLVHRGDVSAQSNTLEGVRMNSWDSELWNIADWSRAK
ncbi:peptide ABC transporter substrate-binding protein [Aliiroseovarius sp. 2305UL8-7]|uniref:peptide ABC transporter substrate-binding protein n=1 Tax=Aliiroseovarius conchicola TaxID=3121637 RepID=UPI0035270CD3